MTSKKVSSNRSVPDAIAGILKTVGVILTLASLFDILVLAMPYQFGDQQWQIGLVTSLSERGIVPLVGIVLFLTGFAINGSTDYAKRPLWQDPRFWACLLASLLGLLYVLAFPFHLNNVRVASQGAVEQVTQQATQAETDLTKQIDTEITSRRQQISQLMTANDDQIAQLVKNGQLTQEQATLVKGFKANPSSVEPFLKKQADELRNQLQTEIGTRKQKAQDSRKTDDLKSGLRVGIGCLLLSIGFITVGWLGLKNLRQA
jgi:hypothetical protein